jgi:hypothetical protein
VRSVAVRCNRRRSRTRRRRPVWASQLGETDLGEDPQKAGASGGALDAAQRNSSFHVPHRPKRSRLREHRPALELLRASLQERSTTYAHVLEAVCTILGEPSAADRLHAIKLAAGGPPQELVGLEPFAPPEIAPTSGARR